MQKGHLLQFSCRGCKTPISFSVFDLDQAHIELQCTHCQKRYVFDDPTLKRQLKKFADLCRQLIDSEEILGQTAVGIDIGEHHVKIPYKLLLTRMSSSLDLTIGGEIVPISFRLEPLKDTPRPKNDGVI